MSVVAGRAALIAEVYATNMTSLRGLIRVVTAMENVVHVEAAVYTERIKDLYAPPGIIPPTKIDSVDHLVLEALKMNGRASYAEIARITNFSASAIRGRVNQLTSRGVVRISTVLTPGMVGLQHMCGFCLRLEGGTENESASIIEAMESGSWSNKEQAKAKTLRALVLFFKGDRNGSELLIKDATHLDPFNDLSAQAMELFSSTTTGSGS